MWGTVWGQGSRQPATPFVTLVCYYFRASPINLCCVTWNTYCRQRSSHRGCRAFEAGGVRSQRKWASRGPWPVEGLEKDIGSLFWRVSCQTKVSSAASEFRSDGDSDLEFVLKNKYWDLCTHVSIYQREFWWIFFKALLALPVSWWSGRVQTRRGQCAAQTLPPLPQSRCKHTKSILQSNNGLLYFGAPVIILVDFLLSLNHCQKWNGLFIR